MIWIYSYWKNLYSFSCQDQYITLFLALQEAFKAKPVLQSKKQFLNKVTLLIKKGYTISPSLTDEHEVWILYKHCWIGFLKLRKSKQIRYYYFLEINCSFNLYYYSLPNITTLYDFICIYVLISKNIQQQNVNGWTTSILKILKKVRPTYTDEDYNAAEQHVANAVLPGAYAHLCKRDWLNSKFFKFIPILTSSFY